MKNKLYIVAMLTLFLVSFILFTVLTVRNIKALNLRGEKSDGLILPIETLAKYTDITKLNISKKIFFL